MTGSASIWVIKIPTAMRTSERAIDQGLDKRVNFGFAFQLMQLLYSYGISFFR